MFDVLVIGGGITGAGISLDAASRGLKVALVDMQDFSAGTSSRSTKLIHGGLRYLKQLEFKLVAQVGKERRIIQKIAPHVTNPEPMLLPIVEGGSLGMSSARLGMWIYEWLAGVKKTEWHRVLSKEQTIAAEPSLRNDNLKGGILFYEYRTDDARLTIEVIKEAVNKGAVALNYMKVISFIYNGTKIAGAKVENVLTKEIIEVKAKHVVNAGGPWVDDLDALDKKINDHKLQITKGVHIVVDWKKLPVKQSLYFDTFDKRMIFVIPRDGKTYIGTTDTFYKDDLVNPLISKEDRDYLLKCANDYFPNNRLEKMDIESGWAGLRPLINKPGKGPSEISRKDELFESTSGMLTIAGGKLTGYRKMAERIVNKLSEKIYAQEKRKLPGCNTHLVSLSGGKIDNSISYQQFIATKINEGIALGLTQDEAQLISKRYGSNCDVIYFLLKDLKNENHELPLFIRAQVMYAIQYEMCVKPSDFCIRRTGALYFDVETVNRYKTLIAQYMQMNLGWADDVYKAYLMELENAVAEIVKLKTTE